MYEDSDSLSGLIPKGVCAEQMEKISGLESVRPVRYMAESLRCQMMFFTGRSIIWQ